MTIDVRLSQIRERAGVVTPGLPILPAGVERHPVPGGGSRAIPVKAGDEISVTDFFGLQPAEIVFFSADGISDLALVDLKPSGGADATIATLSRDQSGKSILEKLGRLKFDLGKARAARFFDDGSKAGDQESFQAKVDGLVLVCAIGEDMSPHLQNTLTDIIVYVYRADRGTAKTLLAPPDPLADPVYDLNIQPGEAHSYEVKKGEFVQILDVQGRECSDFQAFSRRALDKGKEREIDPTTTRSLMGSLYPTPGIFSKFWSVDQEPLVEIVQDTVGRHDTFGLACTARYYDDLGYPGHVNCSDNINAELDQYGIAERGGWPAINFFFNTLLDDNHAIYMDDPWTRPGDYVMLRALTDLVCVSTACPCDIDPANAWEPTDIQVRTYGAQEDFQRSIGWRKTVGGDMQETKQTGFHNSFSKQTRDFVEYNGYWLPNTMTNYGAIAEYWGAREKVAIMDLSPLRKFEVTGPDAEELMQLCVTRNIKKLAVGGIVYTAMCYEHGGMIDDGTVFRLAETNFRWICGNDYSGEWLAKQAREHDFNVWVRESTEQHCNIAVQGPKSRELLSKIIWTPPTQATMEELPWFRFSIGRIADFDGIPIVVSRTGYSGELGYEIFCHPKHADQVFDAVWEAGQEFGIVPLGLEALNMLRVEAGLIFAGYEFTDQTDPFEAGIGFTVPLKTQEDHFIGRPVLEERKEHPNRKLVGLDIEGGVVPATGDCVHNGKARIGEVTSAIKSPILDKVIALARLDASEVDFGKDVEIGQLDGDQKRLKAVIVPFPHFDPTKERVKGNYN